MQSHYLLFLFSAVCSAQRVFCNDSDILACRFKIIAGDVAVVRDCDLGEEPLYVNGTDPPCCPSCMPPTVPYCAAPDMSRICNPGEVPRLNASGCLECRQYCSATRKALCKPSPSLPSCFLHEPWYDASCCPSCAPPLCSLNASRVHDCFLALNDTLNFCPDGVDGRAVLNPATCCPVCRKFPRVTAPAACTLAEFTSCTNVSRECASGERPLIENDQCCRHCKRIERRNFCLPEDVGDCLASRPFCAVGQQPVVLEGECCESCRLPVSPLCINGISAPSCSASQKCLRGPGGNACRGFDQLSVLLAASGLVPTLYQQHLVRLPILRSDAGVGLLIELVRRYCDRTEFRVVCDAFGSAAVEGLHATDPASPVTPSLSWYVVRMQYPVLPDWQCNATLVPYCALIYPPVSFLTFLKRVFADPEATNGLQVTISFGAASSLQPFLFLAVAWLALVGI